MSELIQKNDNRSTMRWKLLTGVSALALTAYVSSANVAKAEDSDRPEVWVELGGQLSRLDNGQETFAPDLFNARPSIFSPSQKFEKPPLYGIDEFGKISFQPEDSSWVFSVSARIGRSVSNNHAHQQTYPKPFVKYFAAYHFSSTRFPHASKFADTKAGNSEQHLIADFQAGKDVGLGMFGGGSSVVSLGVRFAQFRGKTNTAIKSNPDWHFKYAYNGTFKFVAKQPFHSNAASFNAERNFHGVGPSISWNATAPVAGDSQKGEITLDWGLNGALLFGRQRTRTHHQTTALYHPGAFIYSRYPQSRVTLYRLPATPDRTRSRAIIVPNAGGFAALSFRYTDAKISLGYRADFFFNAIDGGIDTRKDENRGFFGPYASISVGMGD